MEKNIINLFLNEVSKKNQSEIRLFLQSVHGKEKKKIIRGSGEEGKI